MRIYAGTDILTYYIDKRIVPILTLLPPTPVGDLPSRPTCDYSTTVGQPSPFGVLWALPI
jgi:hypothetical protein